MNVDLLVSGAVVLPMGGAEPVLDGSVAVSDGTIVAVGPAAEVEADLTADRRIDGRDRILLPGLVNAHTHLALTAVRGVADVAGHPVYDVMWPMESALTPDLTADLAAVGVADSLGAGVTTVADHYFFAEATAERTSALGLRAVIGHTVMSEEGPRTGPAELAAALAFLEGWAGRHPLVVPAAAPHAPDTVRDDWLVELRDAAVAAGTVVHLHLAQSAREVQTVMRRTGRTSVIHLAELGLLDGPLVAAHCTHVTDEELALLAASTTVPVYCPTVHALDGRALRVPELLALGGRFALGTDCSPNERYAVLNEARQAVCDQSLLTGRRRTLRPREVLEAATSGNAAALGLGGQVGRLAPGYAADLLLLRTDSARWAPSPDPFTAVVMVGSDADVDGVWVAGRRVVDGGRLLTADEPQLVAAGRRAARLLRQRAGLES